MTDRKQEDIALEVFDYITKNVFTEEKSKYEVKVYNNHYNVIFYSTMQYKREESTGTDVFVNGTIDILCIENHNGHLIPFFEVSIIENKVQDMINEYYPM